MKKSLFTKRTSTNDDKIVINYKGREFVISRTEYYKRLSLPQQELCSNFASEEARDPEAIVSSSDNIHGSKQDQQVSPQDNPKPQLEEPAGQAQTEQLFTLEDCVESNETFTYQPAPTPEPRPVTSALLEGTSKRSHESLASSKTLPEVTSTLCQLKAQINGLIDETIRSIESNAAAAAPAANYGVGDGGMQPSGDSAMVSCYSVYPNYQVFKTASVEKNKKQIRLEIYNDIEKLVRRLSDMELLE